MRNFSLVLCFLLGKGEEAIFNISKISTKFIFIFIKKPKTRFLLPQITMQKNILFCLKLQKTPFSLLYFSLFLLPSHILCEILEEYFLEMFYTVTQASRCSLDQEFFIRLILFVFQGFLFSSFFFFFFLLNLLKLSDHFVQKGSLCQKPFSKIEISF